MKEFNTTTVCIPSKHYMVDLTERVVEIRKMVDAGKYFTINRARQYGKTTTLNAVRESVKKDYIVLGLSFERMSNDSFSSEGAFVKAFCRLIKKNAVQYGMIPEEIRKSLDGFLLRKDDDIVLDELFIPLGEW